MCACNFSTVFSRLIMALVALTLAGEARAQTSKTSSDKKPNFLLIVADDLCWRDVGFTGNTDVRTPNLDRLAKEGMVLRRMYNPAATCSPTRHALYTGLFCVRSGAFPNHTMVYKGTKSLFHHLTALGYRVGLVGKTHIAPVASFPYEKLGANPDNLKALRQFVSRDKKQPWFAVVASNDPHAPWNRGPKNVFDPAKLKVPAYLHDNLDTRKALAAYYAEIAALDNQVGASLAILDETGEAENTLVIFVSEQGSSMPFGGKWTLLDNGIHAATVVRWPGHVKAGSESNALIQYVDVPPTFVALAGGDPAKIDCGCPDANRQTGFDGRDFSAVLLGKTDRLRDVIFAQHTTIGVGGWKQPYPSRAVYDSRYSLIRNLAPGNMFWIKGIHESALFQSWKKDAEKDPALAKKLEELVHRPAEELYDLQSDPLQRKNLASDAKYAEVKTRLGRELDAWMQQQGDRGLETERKAPSRLAKEKQAEGS
jgi:uncharacterized sulfatase